MRDRRRAAEMGNRLCGARRRPVEERMTKPQRLIRQPSDIDYKKLRKLILSRKLAPCFDALESEDPLLDECPICFLYFPSLNRSTCCAKGICTECFLQMKPSDATRPAQCPFCKTPCYAVEYRGARTEEEKGLEQAEEQKVIEAKLRIQWESENVEQFMHINPTQPSEVLSRITNLGGQSQPDDGGNIAKPGVPIMRDNFEADSSFPGAREMAGFSVDFGEVMMMEAIWQSLQDARLQSTANEPDGSSNTTEAESRTHGASSDSCILWQQHCEADEDRHGSQHWQENYSEGSVSGSRPSEMSTLKSGPNNLSVENQSIYAVHQI